jgi:hypothetical protein
MKTILSLLLLLASFSATAQRTGLGVALGNPVGLSAKRWFDETTAVDAGVGMSFGKKSNFSIHSDYLLHRSSAYYLNDQNPLDLYYGIGGRMEFADDIELGVRLPVGLAHTVEDRNADMFAELAPIIDFVSRTGLELHLLAGARYYF